MVTKSRLISTLSLLALLIASCAPTAVTQGPVPTAETVVLGPALQPTEAPAGKANTSSAATPTAPIVEVTTATPPALDESPTPIPVVTSRGPNLEASDPKTVSMASGGLQFVEFFEFW
jgi:hypothetical protein